jgi:predicted Zn finger-like uncharacterized protein
MAIAAVCPHCEALYKLADDQAGKRVRCRQCKRPFDVAGAAATRGGVHRLERPLGVPPPAIPPALPPRPPAPPLALPASEPEPERLREEHDDHERDRDREPRDSEPLDLPPPPVPNNLVLWVGLGIGGALVLVVALCAGLIWHVSNRVGRGVDRMIDQAKKGQPPIALPALPVTNQFEAMAALRSVDARQRQRGAEWFANQVPDPDPQRRADVRTALQPLLQDHDLGARAAARRASDVWR